MASELLIPLHPTRAGILVIHSWWGRTSSIVDYGAALTREGFTVRLSDLYDGQIAHTEREARVLRKIPRRVPMYRTLEEDLSLLQQAIRHDNPRIGVVGFSMGGHWAVWLSQRPKYEIAATVLYYAARGGDFGLCQSKIQAHFAENDAWVSQKARLNMERAIRRSRCSYQAFDYAGCGHWFAEYDRTDDFQPSSAALAFQRTVRHFGDALK
jgi:carboxymethylenebutenolidase